MFHGKGTDFSHESAENRVSLELYITEFYGGGHGSSASS